MPARLVLLIFLSAGLTVAAMAAGDEGGKTRLWTTPEKTRLVFENESPMQYKTFLLQEPPRLVLDVTLRTHDQTTGKMSAAADLTNIPYLGGVRWSRFDADTLRIVFDLREAVHHQVNFIKPIAGYGHRLLLDIRPQQAPDLLLGLILELEKKKAAPPFLVVIDPGHGGEDPGAVSRNTVYEKSVVLAVSRRVQDALNRREGVRAVLTRRGDEFIPLVRRVQIAQRLSADAFVSIHADSVRSPLAKGSSVFILSQSGASSRLAKRLAKQANLSDLVGGAVPEASDQSVQAALRELSKDGKDKGSRRLAELVIERVAKINSMHSRRVEAAGFAVLKSPSIPSILVETAFISNPDEEKKLLDPDFQRQMAAAIADALMEYRRHYHVARS